MRKASNRLPTGCTASEFAVRVRNFVYRINPNLDRPYVGEAIGKFIINLMPSAYEEAGERILGELKRRGKLGDAAEVSRECLTIVNKRARLNAKTTAAFALGEETPTQGEPQLPVNFRRKPDDWVPDLKTEFCPGCPHMKGRTVTQTHARHHKSSRLNSQATRTLRPHRKAQRGKCQAHEDKG